jgi:hypothetical protein
MQLDLRLPLGMMFGIFGLILVAVGALGPANQTDCCMGININLEWGMVLLVFAAVMLFLTFRHKKEA